MKTKLDLDFIAARLVVRNVSPEIIVKIISWLKAEVKFLEENNVAKNYRAKCVLVKGKIK